MFTQTSCRFRILLLVSYYRRQDAIFLAGRCWQHAIILAGSNSWRSAPTLGSNSCWLVATLADSWQLRGINSWGEVENVLRTVDNLLDGGMLKLAQSWSYFHIFYHLKKEFLLTRVPKRTEASQREKSKKNQKKSITCWTEWYNYQWFRIHTDCNSGPDTVLLRNANDRGIVADRHHVDENPDPVCHSDADPDPACHFDEDVADPHHFDEDPDPIRHFDADPDPACHFDEDPDPTFQFDAVRQVRWLTCRSSGVMVPELTASRNSLIHRSRAQCFPTRKRKITFPFEGNLRPQRFLRSRPRILLHPDSGTDLGKNPGFFLNTNQYVCNQVDLLYCESSNRIYPGLTLP